jgi:hypothetical protein
MRPAPVRTDSLGAALTTILVQIFPMDMAPSREMDGDAHGRISRAEHVMAVKLA